MNEYFCIETGEKLNLESIISEYLIPVKAVLNAVDEYSVIHTESENDVMRLATAFELVDMVKIGIDVLQNKLDMLIEAMNDESWRLKNSVSDTKQEQKNEH